ncbi:hypothetical protein K8354_06595 [Polaribacter litorisediminis]|uniref:hypothetical protein n=1 Tax=Polaribacter litorisediminis TaxID=1908341 RepID=UPI001CC13F48|nr:hypothetical protein [Polaribacter litorisediminis]UAM99472.1 hypothetical protein K8354_06595 [Polaribacter litorisediminis]
MNATRLGKTHSAEVVINSFDFGKIAKLQSENRWDLLDEIMAETGKKSENAKADCLIISIYRRFSQRLALIYLQKGFSAIELISFFQKRCRYN